MRSLTWKLIGLITLIDLAWLMTGSMRLIWPSLTSSLIIPVFLGALGIFYSTIRPDKRIAALCLSVSALASFTLVGAIFNYLTTTLNQPLIDPQLAAIDGALGFDWMQWLSWVNQHDLFGWTVIHAYHSSLMQTFFVIILCLLFKHIRVVDEYVFLFAVTALTSIIIASIWPAAGAYAHFAPAPEHLNNLNPNAGMWHYEQFAALREGTLKAIDADKIEGLITFPSFHTALAIITTYAIRPFRFLLPLFIILNGLLILGTLSEGGHYLIDIIAGAAIASVAILLVRRYERQTACQQGPKQTVAMARSAD